MRRLDCARYDGCLDLAERHGWESFSCNGCRAYVPPGEAELRRDLPGLVKIGRLVW